MSQSHRHIVLYDETTHSPICNLCGIVMSGLVWELEDGRVVCHSCCVEDTKRVIGKIIHKES